MLWFPFAFQDERPVRIKFIIRRSKVDGAVIFWVLWKPLSAADCSRCFCQTYYNSFLRDSEKSHLCTSSSTTYLGERVFQPKRIKTYFCVLLWFLIIWFIIFILFFGFFLSLLVRLFIPYLSAFVSFELGLLLLLLLFWLVLDSVFILLWLLVGLLIMAVLY